MLIFNFCQNWSFKKNCWVCFGSICLPLERIEVKQQPIAINISSFIPSHFSDQRKESELISTFESTLQDMATAAAQDTSKRDNNEDDNTQEQDKDNEDNKEAERSFECNICLDVARDAVVSMCGHLFCWPCLHQVRTKEI